MNEYIRDARIRTNQSEFNMNFNDILLKPGESFVIKLTRESEDIWAISGYRDIPWYKWIERKVKQTIYY